MAIANKDEAVTFLQSYQLMFKDKVGFKHFSGQIGELIEFVEKLAAENEELRAGYGK
jgi:hypothetical protein